MKQEVRTVVQEEGDSDWKVTQREQIMVRSLIWVLATQC